MIKSGAIRSAAVAIAVPLSGAAAQTLSPAMEFEARTTTPAKTGTSQPAHITIQSWGLAGQRGQNGTEHEIALRGFYLAHLLSGDIATTMDGQTVKRAPGDYWIVKSGATMQVKVLGEYAMLETIVVTKD